MIAAYKEADRLGFTDNAIIAMEDRYLMKNEQGKLIETPAEMVWRVASAVAEAEKTKALQKTWAHRFYDSMAAREFIPNSPTWMNAGKPRPGSFCACFVIPIPDSLDGILHANTAVGLVQRSGGGTGHCLDLLRPTDDYIQGSGGRTSGPLSFWSAIAGWSAAIQQGAHRRGANMMMMIDHHPDILKFIVAKQNLTEFVNYNISVKVTDEFMEAATNRRDDAHVVINPRTKKRYLLPKSLDIPTYSILDLIPEEKFDGQPVWSIGEIMDMIVHQAWRTGEPGLCFIDEVHRKDPGVQAGLYRVDASNPCGEQFLEPWGQCTLGSIDLSKLVEGNALNEDRLRDVIYLGVRFLDNVLDTTPYPLPEIRGTAMKNRRIGLGPMGLADALFRLGIPYDSDDAVAFCSDLAHTFSIMADEASEQLGKEKGIPEGPQAAKLKQRNIMTTTVAPTGTISIFADCSCGIEPLFSLSFKRKVLQDRKGAFKEMKEVNKWFLKDLEKFREEEVAGGEQQEWTVERVLDYAKKTGSIQNLVYLSPELRELYKTAMDISPSRHVEMQAAWQESIANSVSKTINLSHSATELDVRKAYFQAWKTGCKGITVYRDGCRENQPMSLETSEKSQEAVQATPITTSSWNGKIPDVRPAIQISQKSPFGTLHTTVTVKTQDHDRLLREIALGVPTEIFAHLGKQGEIPAADLEGMGRLASKFLRKGGTIEEVIEQLEGIGSTLTVPSRNGQVRSIPDALAKSLSRVLDERLERAEVVNLLEEVPTTASNHVEAYGLRCPKCNDKLRMQEGCMSCDCGYSKC